MATKVKIKGFRSGKAPRAVIDKMIGRETVLHEALHEIIPDIYPKAVEKAGIEPVTSPEIDVVQILDNKPLIFKAKVQVKPEVKLPSLDKMVVDLVAKKTVADEVKKRIEKLRNKFATLNVVKNRASRKGDFILIDFEGFVGGKPFEGGQASDYMLELGSGDFIPGFEEQLVGVKTKSDIEIKVKFPESYQTEFLVGQDAVFMVKVKEIKSRKKPKVDDEFAKNVSKFDTLKEMKEDIKKTSTEQVKRDNEQQFRTNALDKLVELSEVEVPQDMVKQRVEQMVLEFQDRVRQGGEGGENSPWLKESSDELNALRQSYTEEAERGLKTDLALAALMKREKIEVSEKEVDSEIMRLAKGSKRDFNELKEEIKNREGNAFLKHRLSMNKTVEFLAKKTKVKKNKEKE